MTRKRYNGIARRPRCERLNDATNVDFCPCAQRRGFSFPEPFGKEEFTMSKNIEAKKVVVSEIEE